MHSSDLTYKFLSYFGGFSLAFIPSGANVLLPNILAHGSSENYHYLNQGFCLGSAALLASTYFIEGYRIIPGVMSVFNLATVAIYGYDYYNGSNTVMAESKAVDINLYNIAGLVAGFTPYIGSLGLISAKFLSNKNNYDDIKVGFVWGGIMCNVFALQSNEYQELGFQNSIIDILAYIGCETLFNNAELIGQENSVNSNIV